MRFERATCNPLQRLRRLSLFHYKHFFCGLTKMLAVGLAILRKNLFMSVSNFFVFVAYFSKMANFWDFSLWAVTKLFPWQVVNFIFIDNASLFYRKNNTYTAFVVWWTFSSWWLIEKNSFIHHCFNYSQLRTQRFCGVAGRPVLIFSFKEVRLLLENSENTLTWDLS